MRLIDKINGDKELLSKFSKFMYFMNKEVAKNDFSDFLKFVDMDLNDWKVLKEWLTENGLKTYN